MALIIISKQNINQYCVRLDGHLKQRGEERFPRCRESIRTQILLPKKRCKQSSSRSQELRVDLSSWLRNDGKWKSHSQSNYCPDCLLFSFSEATSSPVQQFSSDEGERANKGSNNLCCLTQSIHAHEPILLKTGEFLISREKRKLKELTRIQPRKAQPLEVTGWLQKWYGTVSVGISPRFGFVLLFQLQTWHRES